MISVSLTVGLLKLFSLSSPHPYFVSGFSFLYFQNASICISLPTPIPASTFLQALFLWWWRSGPSAEPDKLLFLRSLSPFYSSLFLLVGSPRPRCSGGMKLTAVRSSISPPGVASYVWLISSVLGAQASFTMVCSPGPQTTRSPTGLYIRMHRRSFLKNRDAWVSPQEILV